MCISLFFLVKKLHISSPLSFACIYTIIHVYLHWYHGHLFLLLQSLISHFPSKFYTLLRKRELIPTEVFSFHLPPHTTTLLHSVMVWLRFRREPHTHLGIQFLVFLHQHLHVALFLLKIFFQLSNALIQTTLLVWKGASFAGIVTDLFLEFIPFRFCIPSLPFSCG